MTGGDTYSVELTFKQWMLVSASILSSSNRYEGQGAQGEANRYHEIRNEIGEQIEKMPDSDDEDD